MAKLIQSSKNKNFGFPSVSCVADFNVKIALEILFEAIRYILKKLGDMDEVKDDGKTKLSDSGEIDNTPKGGTIISGTGEIYSGYFKASRSENNIRIQDGADESSEIAGYATINDAPISCPAAEIDLQTGFLVARFELSYDQPKFAGYQIVDTYPGGMDESFNMVIATIIKSGTVIQQHRGAIYGWISKECDE